jgi:hypothetical protein
VRWTKAFRKAAGKELAVVSKINFGHSLVFIIADDYHLLTNIIALLGCNI